tara:strand:+ start:2525 stop:3886 length:1362 start_codon:yes stop_codon:yes gene_type:complete
MESRLVVHSWDFDGMLASDTYAEKLKELVIQAASEERPLNHGDYLTLARFIVETYKEFFDKQFLDTTAAKHVVYVGSDRQDYKTDLINGFKAKMFHITLSCYPFFSALVEAVREQYKVNITLDKLLLEDIYHHLEAGTSFRQTESCYLALDAEFYQKLAREYGLTNHEQAWDLFDQIKDSIISQNPHKDDLTRLPRYINTAKLLIMYTQILHSTSEHAKGGSIDYHFADDRYDVLSGASKSLLAALPYIPVDTRIFLEQFIPPEMLEEQRRVQPEKYGAFVQDGLIVGTGRNAEKSHITFVDIAKMHKLLNVAAEEDITLNVLTETITRRAQDKALLYIDLCIKAMCDTDKPSKGIKAIKELIDSTPKESPRDVNVNILEEIKGIAVKKMKSKVQTLKKQSTFFKNNATTANFYQALVDLDVNNPDTSGLEATYLLIRKGAKQEPSKKSGKLI